MPADEKTRERTENAAKAVQAIHGDSFSTNRVDPDSKRSTTFGNDSTGPRVLPCLRDNALVGNGAAAPKSCLSPLKMHSPTAARGLLPARMASTVTRTAFDQPPPRFYSTEETNSKRAPIQYAPYYSSFWGNNLLAALSCRRVIETKSGENMVFDPGGSNVVSMPARFWERGARCFVRRFTLGRWKRLQRFLAEV